MSKIIIIGNSAAAFSAYQALVKNPSSFEITVVSKEETVAYKRSSLLEFLADNVKEKELFLCSPDFYEQSKINLLKDSEVVKIDPKKQRVILKDNTKLDYDYLIIATGEEINIPDIPGKQKDGIFSVYSLADVKEIKSRVAITHTICIIGAPEECLRISDIILSKYADKEVKIISKPKPESFVSTENREWIDALDPVEFIGEGSELKAIKFNNGKIIAAPLIIFTGSYVGASDFTRDSGISTKSGYIIVDENMRTNFDNIFAAGCVCKNTSDLNKIKNWQDALTEGAHAADNIIKLNEGRS